MSSWTGIGSEIPTFKVRCRCQDLSWERPGRACPARGHSRACRSVRTTCHRRLIFEPIQDLSVGAGERLQIPLSLLGGTWEFLLVRRAGPSRPWTLSLAFRGQRSFLLWPHQVSSFRPCVLGLARDSRRPCYIVFVGLSLGVLVPVLGAGVEDIFRGDGNKSFGVPRAHGRQFHVRALAVPSA